jgi:hypothetical protein
LRVVAKTLLGFVLGAIAVAPLPALASAPASFAEAVRYEHGEGVTQDYAHAIALYCDAVREGSADAAYNLGWMFLNGRGVKRDDAVGVAWLRRATEGGNPQAPRLLALLGNWPQTETAGCPAPPAPTAAFVPPQEIVNLVAMMAPKYHIDPKLVLAVIATESAFQANAVSPKNAQGLMQLLPETAQRFGVKNVFDPAENIQGGVKYLRWLIGYFDGDLPLVLAAYNAGEKAVLRYGGVPPYPETITYLRRIGSLYPAAARAPRPLVR